MPVFHKPNLISLIFLFIICLFIFNKNFNYKFLNQKLKRYKILPISILFFILLPIIITDQSGRVIKKLEIRDRPWVGKGVEQVNCLVCKVDTEIPNLYSLNKSAHKSFPSNHAANSFALALIISFFFPRLKKMLYILAFIISFSRVYIGVHYPLDILYGACLGILASYLVMLIFNLYIKNKKLIR